MPASNLRWMDTPVSYGAEFKLDSGAWAQLTTSRYGTGSVYFSVKAPRVKEWSPIVILDDKWAVDPLHGPRPFRDMVKTFMEDIAEHSRLREQVTYQSGGPRFRAARQRVAKARGA